MRCGFAIIQGDDNAPGVGEVFVVFDCLASSANALKVTVNMVVAQGIPVLSSC